MIKTEKLCKTFGEIKAVNEVSLTITDNIIFGLAGTNGAGKSTRCVYWPVCSDRTAERFW